MSDKKAVFFDADGTICDMEKGVPDSLPLTFDLRDKHEWNLSPVYMS